MAIDFDDSAVANELANNPGSDYTEKGFSILAQHPAKKLLEAEIKEGKCNGMLPAQIQLTRPDSQV